MIKLSDFLGDVKIVEELHHTFAIMRSIFLDTDLMFVTSCVKLAKQIALDDR